ncbi:hypothetical protein CVT25_000179 [Psilocybe cyanescens]|uniref:peptidylprolyl isomerase n=1 Tax=Psilocybe cyanescens TaxID=93625 RepID=A0A409XQH0_PSICY|nr:hypothetical protein CVT25_000179 [Psilocybe cyanescens]
MKLFAWISAALLATVALAEEAKTPPTELQIETTYLPENCVTKAETGDRIKVHYVSSSKQSLDINKSFIKHAISNQTGTLFSNGNKFDSSLDRGQPLPLTRNVFELLKVASLSNLLYVVGIGQVIKGWDQGLQGMCVNEKRTLTIPAELAYGPRGFGSIIPANSALVFTVELVDLESTGKAREEL